MDKILIDLSPLKSGGGCQLAYNFLTVLSNLPQQNFVILKPDIGPLAQIDTQFTAFEIITAPTSKVVPRLRFERFELPRIYEKYGIKKIFTFFGPGLPHPSHIKSIVSVAYPIICYDDSPFWQHLPFKAKIKQKAVNFARKNRLKKADVIIAETPVMQKRLADTLSRDTKDIKIIEPAPSLFVTEGQGKKTIDSNCPQFLILSGTLPHKNVWRLIEIAQHLSKLLPDFKITITTTLEQFKALPHSVAFDAAVVEKHFNFKGTVHPSQIGTFYENTDFLTILSDLESFSNNYMEAWKAGVAIISSDRDFARAACLNSAVYVEPHNAAETAQKMAAIAKDNITRYQLIQEGKNLLQYLPDPQQRTQKILDIILN